MATHSEEGQQWKTVNKPWGWITTSVTRMKMVEAKMIQIYTYIKEVPHPERVVKSLVPETITAIDRCLTVVASVRES